MDEAMRRILSPDLNPTDASSWEVTCKKGTGTFIFLHTHKSRSLNLWDSDSSTYASEADSIIERTTALSPELSKHSFETLAAFSGLRPSREGCARIERTDIDVAGHTRIIVHNYGAGGTGFQAGYGMATESVDTINDVLKQWSSKSSAKL